MPTTPHTLQQRVGMQALLPNECQDMWGAHPLAQDGHDALQLRIAARGLVRLQDLPERWAGGRRTSMFGMQVVQQQQLVWPSCGSRISLGSGPEV